VTSRHFLLTAVPALLATALALALAEILDAPWLRLVAVALLIVIFAAREIWQWWGDGRLWLATTGALLTVIALAFIAQRIAG
jgi:hypothetical protein